MKSSSVCVVLLLCFISVTGLLAADDSARQAREQYSHLLSDPTRDAWQLPDQVVQALAPKSNEVVLEIGADEGGYFARRFAPLVSNVYVVNPVQQELDTYDKEAPPNQQTFLSSLSDLQIHSNHADTVFLYNALSSIPNRPAFYALVGSVLRGQGRIVVIDFFKQSPPSGLPPSKQITASVITAEMQAAGFTLTQSFGFLPLQFFLVFQH